MESMAFLDALFDACKNKKIQAFQVQYSRAQTQSLEVFEQKITKQTHNNAQKVLLKIMHEGKIGVAFCENLCLNNIDYLIEKAKENSLLIDCDDIDFFYDGKGKYKKVTPYVPDLKTLQDLDKFEFLKSLEQKAYQADKRINKVITTAFGQGEKEIVMRNSLGLNLADKQQFAYAYIYLSATDGKLVKTESKETAFQGKDDFDVNKMVEDAVTKVVKKLDAKDISNGCYPVLFEGKAFNNILMMLKGLVEAKNVQEHKSKFEEKLGKTVASDVLTVIDDPFLFGGFGTGAFDGEGCPSQYKEIIKDGVLQTYLYNLKTAHKAHVLPSGNDDGNDVMVFNFYVKPGKKSKETLISEIKNGVLIDALNGIHAGYDMVSGDFSFGASGFEIVDGKIGQYLNQFTVSGNIYHLLENIVAIGNDLDFDYGQYGAPSVWVSSLNLSK